jgi:anti-sigma regulatory factor (Ser/Thr protein kinase)
MIQKLLIFAGEDKVASQKVGLETAVAKALKNVEGKILSKGVKLNKNFQATAPFTMPVDLIVRAIENVLINSIEAMERAPRKELNISLRSQEDTILLTIEDTGEGISAQNMPKVFDPFFTTRGNVNHVGLGLSTAMGILREVSGEMQIDSQQGQGTKVTMSFMPEAAEAAKEAPAAVTPANPFQPLPKTSSPAAPAVAAAKPVVAEAPLDPLLVDNTIERLIEGDVPDMPPPPSENLIIDLASEVLKAPAKPEVAPDMPAPSAPAPTSPTEKPSFSAKIDKPKIEFRKKASRVDEEVQIAVRRPGDRQ